jgi:hypothetical protein
MSAFELKESLERARGLPKGKGRRDRGTSRFPDAVERFVTELFHARERPRFVDAHRALAQFCEAEALPVPTRSSLYNAVSRVPVPDVSWGALPPAVRASLYNLEPSADDDRLPGDQVVFHAFNHGAPRALSYAAGMPWLCLWRAEKRRGWRPKSRALLRAVMRYRGIA